MGIFVSGYYMHYSFVSGMKIIIVFIYVTPKMKAVWEGKYIDIMSGHLGGNN